MRLKAKNMNKINRDKIIQLLNQWETTLYHGELASLENASKIKDGLKGRIKKTTGPPVIFDFDSYDRQGIIQRELCREWPGLTEVILSVPDIMNGYAWTRSDFIELYFSYYRLVIQKLRRIIEKTHE